MKKTHKRSIGKRIALGAFSVAALPLAVAAYDALDVTNPVMPAVGESSVGACDKDGVTTSYTYGSTRTNGVRVNAVQVSSIAAACTNGTVSFMNGTTEVAAYTGAVADGTLSLNTNIWTNEFTSVRVALYP